MHETGADFTNTFRWLVEVSLPKASSGQSNPIALEDGQSSAPEQNGAGPSSSGLLLSALYDRLLILRSVITVERNRDTSIKQHAKAFCPVSSRVLLGCSDTHHVQDSFWLQVGPLRQEAFWSTYWAAWPAAMSWQRRRRRGCRRSSCASSCNSPTMRASWQPWGPAKRSALPFSAACCQGCQALSLHSLSAEQHGCCQCLVLYFAIF